MNADLSRLPPIATERLRLRPLAIRDAEDLRQLTDDPAILSAVHILTQPFTIDAALAMIRRSEDGGETFLGGRLAADGRLALVCGVHLEGQDFVEIGYWVGTAHQRAGLAFEAVGAMLSILRVVLPARRPFAECRPENLASARLLERLGFRTDGRPGRRPGRLRYVLSDFSSSPASRP